MGKEKHIHDLRWLRRITNKELADLPETWENQQVDTRKYKETPFKAYEAHKGMFLVCKEDGYLVQEYKGKYYIGSRP